MKLANIKYALRKLGEQRGLSIEDVVQRPDGSVGFVWERVHRGSETIGGSELAACSELKDLVDLVAKRLDAVAEGACRS